MPRIEKVNEAIRRELGNMILLGHISDPRVRHVTIMSVEVSKDLQYARVKFSTLSEDPGDIAAAAAGLDSCRGLIRKLIAERVPMRYTPQYTFIYDKSMHYADQVEKALEEIKKLKPVRKDNDEAV